MMELFASIAGEAMWYGLGRLIEFGLAKKLFSCPIRDQSQMSVYGSNRMVMDGDILSPMRIESFEKVMDDNKVLTLANNERTQTMRLPVDWYEYMANNPRLDVTLLTNECYVITLPQVVQLVELLEVRHSVFIIGVAGTGKTEVWKTLYRTYANLRFKPYFNEIEPYTVTNDDFFGVINPISGEIVDELFSCLIRDQSQMSVYGSNRMMVMDGDISPMWTSPPATVCWNPYVAVWVDTSDNVTQKAAVLVLFDKYVLICLEALKTIFVIIKPIPEITHTQMLCTLLDCLSTSINCPPENAYGTYFVFTCLSAFGSPIFQDQLIDWRVEISKWCLTELKTIKISSSGSVFNYFIDPEPNGPSLDLVSSFELNPDIHLQQTLVSTIETTRIRYFLNLLVDKKIMLAGADDDIFKSLSNDLYTVANVPLNFYTISEMLQKILEKPLEKKAKFLVDGKTLINFIEDGISENEDKSMKNTSGPICHAVPQGILDSAIKITDESVFGQSLVRQSMFISSNNTSGPICHAVPQGILDSAIKITDESVFGQSLVRQSMFISSNNTSGPICHAVPQGILDSAIKITDESEQTQILGLNDSNKIIVQKAMKKLPTNLGDYHPVQLLNELLPGLQYHVKVLSNPPADILVHCTINKITIVGRAPSKKLAQREIAVYALANFYGVQFNNC